MVLLQQGIPENLHESLIFDEDQRALDVCRLIMGLSLDGIARMNAGFKVLLCDYASVGVKLLFSSNATVPRAQKRKEDPTLPRDLNRVSPPGFRNDFVPQSSWEWIRSDTWHYDVSAYDAGSTKETRIELDLCGFVTYYDPYLRSLSDIHRCRTTLGGSHQNGWGYRKGHRHTGVSRSDVGTVRQ
jgi:hypothetical protein